MANQRPRKYVLHNCDLDGGVQLWIVVTLLEGPASNVKAKRIDSH